MLEIRRFLILTLIGFVLFLFSSNVFAEEESKLFMISLRIQKFVVSFWDDLKSLIRKEENDDYREKYFNLLQEISQLKLNLKKVEERRKSLEELSNLVPLIIYKKDPRGIFYANYSEKANEGDIVVDKNLALIGFIYQKNKDYLVIKTLLYPDIIFNLGDAENNLLGSGKTVNNGFVEISEIQNQKARKDMLVFTQGGDSIFRPNFLVGTISEIEQLNKNSFRLIIRLLGLFDEDKFFIYK